MSIFIVRGHMYALLDKRFGDTLPMKTRAVQGAVLQQRISINRLEGVELLFHLRPIESELNGRSAD
jgi:hypothetical protein